MHGVKMKDNLNVSNLLRIYETEISKNVKNKKKKRNRVKDRAVRLMV